MGRRPRPAIIAALAVALLMFSLSGGGCAARQAPSIARPESSPASQKDREPTPTIETTDAQLAAALRSLKPKETADGLKAVADAYLRLNIFDQAITYLGRAIAQQPKDVALLSARARAYRDWGQPETGLGDATRAVALSPASPDARNTLGTIQFALGMLAEAASTFERALAAAPNASWALNNLCYVALIGGDEATAIARCEAAVQSDPSSATARNNLALVHASAGRMDDARMTLMLGGDRPLGLYNIGIMLMARREYLAAADAFGEACRLVPSFDAACRRRLEAKNLAARTSARPPL